MTFHLIDYSWLVWAGALAMLSASAAIVARRVSSMRLWLASAIAALSSFLWLARFAFHWFVGAECAGERCLMPAPYATLLAAAASLVPWLAMLSGVILLHYALRPPRAA